MDFCAQEILTIVATSLSLLEFNRQVFYDVLIHVYCTTNRHG